MYNLDELDKGAIHISNWVEQDEVRFFFPVCGCFACMCVYGRMCLYGHMCQCPWRCQILWSWNHGWLWAAIYILETEPRSSLKTNALNCWVSSLPPPHNIILFVDCLFACLLVCLFEDKNLDSPRIWRVDQTSLELIKIPPASPLPLQC